MSDQPQNTDVPNNLSMSKMTTATQKWLYALMFAAAFIVISSPPVYSLVNSVFSLVGVQIASPDGCPNAVGLLVHGIVFFLVARGLIEVPL